MAKPRGKRAVARGISRGKIPLDPCRVHLPRLKKLSADALNSVWYRVSSRGGRSDKALAALASWASNYGAAKRSVSIYKDDPKQRAHAVRIYLHAARMAEANLKKSCAIRRKVV